MSLEQSTAHATTHASTARAGVRLVSEPLRHAAIAGAMTAEWLVVELAPLRAAERGRLLERVLGAVETTLSSRDAPPVTAQDGSAFARLTAELTRARRIGKLGVLLVLPELDGLLGATACLLPEDSAGLRTLIAATELLPLAVLLPERTARVGLYAAPVELVSWLAQCGYADAVETELEPTVAADEAGWFEDDLNSESPEADASASAEPNVTAVSIDDERSTPEPEPAVAALADESSAQEPLPVVEALAEQENAQEPELVVEALAAESIAQEPERFVEENDFVEDEDVVATEAARDGTDVDENDPERVDTDESVDTDVDENDPERVDTDVDENDDTATVAPQAVHAAEAAAPLPPDDDADAVDDEPSPQPPSGPVVRDLRAAHGANSATARAMHALFDEEDAEPPHSPLFDPASLPAPERTAEPAPVAPRNRTATAEPPAVTSPSVPRQPSAPSQRSAPSEPSAPSVAVQELEPPEPAPMVVQTPRPAPALPSALHGGSPEEVRRWIAELDAARGPKPLAVIERLFSTVFVPLREAVVCGNADAEAERALTTWSDSFEKSYLEAFDALRHRGKRPTMVLDLPELAQRVGRMHGARSVQLLLVDGLRYDLGLRVHEYLRRLLGQNAVLAERFVAWSALPTTSSTQLALLGRGPEGLRDPRHDDSEPPVARGRSASALRRVRAASKELMKLDVVEARLAEPGAPPYERFDSIALEAAETIANHFLRLPPRTLVLVFGDHGFFVDERPGRHATVRQGGATPEEVLVPAFSWLVGSVH